MPTASNGAALSRRVQVGHSTPDCILMYLQTHHLDLEYYDRLFEPGAYLETHRHHFCRWHASRD